MNAKYTRSPMSFGSGLLVLLMFLWMQCATVHAQAITNDNNIGFPENAIFHGGDIETVQVTNGNLHIEDTIWSAKGRGLDTGYKLLYNNKTWRVDIDCSDYDGVCFGSADGGTAVGVVGPFDWDEYDNTVAKRCDFAWGEISTVVMENIVFKEADGTKHHFNPDPVALGNPNDCTKQLNLPTGVTRFYADDGSGWILTAAPAPDGRIQSAIRKDGTKFAYATNNKEIIDSNGNFVLQKPLWQQPNQIIDTVGRVFNTDGSYDDSSGTLRGLTITNTTAQVLSHMCGFASIPLYSCTEWTTPITVPQTVTFPSGVSFSFQYKSYDSVHGGGGEPSSMTLPTGAAISWIYGDWDPAGRPVATRTVSVGGTTGTWTYLPPRIVIDPQGTKTTYTCLGSNDDPCYPTQQQVQDASGQVLKTTTTDYAAYWFDLNPQHIMFLPTRETTTWNQQNQVSKVETDWDLVTVPNGYGGTATVSWKNPVNRREYAYGIGAAGSLVRQTHYDYVHLSSQTYQNRNLADLVSNTIVYDGSGNLVALSVNSYDSTPVLSDLGGAPNHDDGSYSMSFTTRGNLTQVQHWLNPGNTYITTATNTYDDLGNLRQTTDGNNNSTYFNYSDSWYANTGCVPGGSNAQAYVTQVTNALSQSSRSAYYPCTGLLGQSQDANDLANNRTGTTQTYDAMNRVTQIDYADGGQKIYSYSDDLTTFPAYVMETTKLDASNVTRTWTGFDGLGRKARVAKLNGEASPNVVDMSDTCYDALGRVSVQNYPFQGPGWGQGINCSPATGDSPTYDALGRVTQVTHPDGSHVDTDYSQFPVVTVTDEAGRQRRNQSDALGRLLTVWEPDGNGNLSYETDYYYNTLDNLEHVVQKGNDPNSARQRDFQYDSLSRLTFANNPESGAIYFGYDANGNLISKISPMPNQTGATQIQFYFGYDQLNRLIWRWNYTQASDPVDRYYYDLNSVWGTTVHNSIGRLVLGQSDGGSNGSTGTIHSYDLMGREEFALEYNKRGNPSVHKQFNYAYNLDGSLKSITYPSARVVNYGYNVGQRPISAVDSNNNSFATAAHYTGSGALGYVVNGATSSFGGIVATANYNVRMQPNEIHVAAGTQPPLLDLIYDYNSCGGNNGNVCAVTNTKDSARSQAFAYDYLNRLVWAWTPNLNSGGSHNWGESFSYDPWGNLLQKNTMGSDNPPDTSLNITVSTKNQAINWCYDAAGNVVRSSPCPTSGSGTIGASAPNVYDGENRLINTIGGVTYDYGAGGERVEKSHPDGTGTLYWYGPGGEALQETDLSGNLQNEYMFFGGKRVTRYNPTNGYSYYFSDHLGSADVVTDASGNIKEESDFYPFGGERVVTDLGLDNRYKFTGKERDPETGCDYFGARYYCNPIGRFITPDWADKPTDVPYANFGNPQSLNLYSYVQNNPTTFGDPDGHCNRGDWCGYLAGAVNAYASDNMFGALRADSFLKYTDAEQRGATLGDGLATAQGLGEATLGTVGNLGGLVLDATGVGAIIGVPANVVSTGLMVHGGGTAIVGGAHLLKDLNQPPNPHGSSGAPDHQAKVGELVDKAKGEAKSGESVESNTKVKNVPSNRRPDAQIIDKQGKTRKVFEAERHPNRQRNRNREEEYKKLKLKNETHPL